MKASTGSRVADADRAAMTTTGASVMIALVSIPVLVLCWLLLGIWQRHESQHQEGRDVIAIYRDGLAVFPPLERMRALSRVAFQVGVTAEGEVFYNQAVGEAQTKMDIFLARVGRRGETVPTLAAPLGRLEQMPRLENIVIELEATPLGPLPAINRYADGIHRLMAAVLYGADLSGRRGAQTTAMLLLITDTVRRLRHELAVLQVLVLPADMAPGDYYSGDVQELDRAWSALIEFTDTLESQLLDIEQRHGPLPAGKDLPQLVAVRDYIDFVDTHLILGTSTSPSTGTGIGGVRWQDAWERGLRAQQAIVAIEGGLVDAAEARLQAARAIQHRNDVLMAAGLFVLYGAIVYLMRHYYRARGAAHRERDLRHEMEARRRREHELTQLNLLGEALMACHDEGEAFAAFAHSAAALFPGMRGALALAPAGSDQLAIACHWGGEAPLAPLFTPAACAAMRAGRPLRFSGVDDACAHYREGQVPTVPHACIPVKIDGEALSLLWLECSKPVTATLRPVDGEVLAQLWLEGVPEDGGDLQLGVSASELLKLALATIRLRERLQEQAVRDVLTGLYNRRELLDVFPREIAYALRTGQPLSVAMLDLDHFKQVNDTYGHDSGDQVLVALARHIRDNLRASDFAFRFGGEEFVLLLRTNLPGSRKAVDALRTGFHEMCFTFHEAAPVQLSFSAGVVEAPLFGQDLDALLKFADEALYRAKAGGRNRVELAELPATVADPVAVPPPGLPPA